MLSSGVAAPRNARRYKVSYFLSNCAATNPHTMNKHPQHKDERVDSSTNKRNQSYSGIWSVVLNFNLCYSVQADAPKKKVVVRLFVNAVCAVAWALSYGGRASSLVVGER